MTRQMMRMMSEQKTNRRALEKDLLAIVIPE
jgi:hypothetical protein